MKFSCLKKIITFLHLKGLALHLKKVVNKLKSLFNKNQ